MSRSANHYSPTRVSYVQERVAYRPAEVVQVRSTSSGAPGTIPVRASQYDETRYSRYGMAGSSFQGAETRPTYEKKYSPLRKSGDEKKVSFQDGKKDQP